MTTCFLIRHAHAGTRGSTNDAHRELSDRGRAQANALVESLGPSGITAVVSSPFTRCVQTVEPIAAVESITIDHDEGLAEGAGIARALHLIEHAHQPLVVCSHGDIIGDVMNHLSRSGVVLDDHRVAKGSTWVLTVDAGTVTAAHYVGPGA